MTRKPTLVVYNLHTDDYPREPVVDDGSLYVSYYRNVHGEQWIFWYDPQIQQAFLTGGDVGWEVYEVGGGTEPMHNLILNREEQIWLMACWKATR